MKKWKIWLSVLVLAASVCLAPGRSYAKEAAPAEEEPAVEETAEEEVPEEEKEAPAEEKEAEEEPAEEEEVEYADPEEFMTALREAMDAGYEAQEEEDVLHAAFRAEAEYMEEYWASLFEDEKLNAAVDLYYRSLDGIIGSEAFQDSPKYFEVLENSAYQQYCVAVLTLCEDYGLELRDDELEAYMECIGVEPETERAPENADGETRVTIGSYSYVIPEGFAFDEEESDDESTVYATEDGTQKLMIAGMNIEEELGEYAAMKPLLLDIMFASLEEEFAEEEDVEISDVTVLGSKGKCIRGSVDADEGPAEAVMVVALTDTDLLVFAYYEEPNLAEEKRLDFDAWLEKIEPVEAE